MSVLSIISLNAASNPRHELRNKLTRFSHALRNVLGISDLLLINLADTSSHGPGDRNRSFVLFVKKMGNLVSKT